MENYRIFQITRDYPARIAESKMASNMEDDKVVSGLSNVRITLE